ncbi:TPA: hypothetical protein TUM69_000664 [Streptococcus equi subsp. zooepidemicus]|uniref:hypothetical protein n=1 Tax=Streptococcus infantarius TaxID=102684 RepID=UPI00208E47CE|nr:hypothetical protein [Streptococcus infantarius subsp. infantarius]HEL0414893.1 hypothetical protein [Streptococcus equi subsp. zooepidemicus]HEQ1486010.1 hypothetical protein [Streptococcus pyogenes]MCO4505318.1 hypothetical protein [Streptococcus infantarius subsp. infantarius]HEL0428338.1 hypothetical protein [Streptococcus equi subsp. zooepidemicus]
MPQYKATKNLFFKSLNKDVIVGEVIELEKDYADNVNADLASAFPDVQAVLVPLDEEVTEKPKRTRKKAKTDTETEE